MPLANRDGRQPIEEPIHDLHRGLRCRVAHAARNDNRSVPVAAAESGASEVLREAADQANGRSRAERGQIVLIDLVAQSGIANLVQPEELVEAVTPTVGHEEPMEGHSQTRLPERL